MFSTSFVVFCLWLFLLHGLSWAASAEAVSTGVAGNQVRLPVQSSECALPMPGVSCIYSVAECAQRSSVGCATSGFNGSYCANGVAPALGFSAASEQCVDAAIGVARGPFYCENQFVQCIS